MNELEEVIKGILEIADKERKSSEPYKDLFKKTNGKPFPVQLFEMEGKMMSIVLDYTTILNENGYKVNTETWKFLLSLPILAYELEKDIVAKEGSVCCVDKTYEILHKRFQELLNN